MKMHCKNVFFLLTTILAISIGLVSSDGGTSGGGNPSHQQHSGGGGGGGGGSGGSLTVVVSYESLNTCSQDFFKNQLTNKVFEELSQCNIDWKIYPCATSKQVMGKLMCLHSDTECAADRIYACATKLNEGNMKSVGKFAICLMNAGSAQCSAQNCATQAGLKWDKIEACSKTSQADTDCNEYWEKANDEWQMLQLPSVMVPPKYVENDAVEAKKDFKGFVCKKLKEKNISCSVCGGGSSGGGGQQGNPPGGSNPGGSSPGGSHPPGGSNPGGSSPGGPCPGTPP